jgi:hypothetical protein
VISKAKAADEAVLALIRERPNIRTGEIVEAMGANGSTMAERLRRLKDVGEISGGKSHGWTAAAA